VTSKSSGFILIGLSFLENREHCQARQVTPL
jgi:hypothetical protein